MCGCGATEVVTGITLKEVAGAVALVSAPLGIFVSSVFGAVKLSGFRQKSSIALLAIAASFLVLLTIGYFSSNSYSRRFHGVIDFVFFSLPFLALPLWAYSIINHSTDASKLLDRFSLWGIYLSSFAIIALIFMTEVR